MTAFVALTVVACFLHSPADDRRNDDPPFAQEFTKIKAATEKIQQDAFRAFNNAKTQDERESLQAEAFEVFCRGVAPLAEQALGLVTPHVQDPAAVDVLTWVLTTHPTSTTAIKAADLLIQHHLTDPKTQAAADRFAYAPRAWSEKLLRALVASDLPPEKKGLAMFRLAHTLKSEALVARIMRDTKSDEPASRLRELFSGKEYVAHLQSVDPEKLDAEAIQLFTRIMDEYGDHKAGPKTLGQFAKSAIYEIEHLSTGKPAPEISGADIDGNPMKLSDFRGKVVLLDFWGHW